MKTELSVKTSRARRRRGAQRLADSATGSNAAALQAPLIPRLRYRSYKRQSLLSLSHSLNLDWASGFIVTVLEPMGWVTSGVWAQDGTALLVVDIHKNQQRLIFSFRGKVLSDTAGIADSDLVVRDSIETKNRIDPRTGLLAVYDWSLWEIELLFLEISRCRVDTPRVPFSMLTSLEVRRSSAVSLRDQ